MVLPVNVFTNICIANESSALPNTITLSAIDQLVFESSPTLLHSIDVQDLN